ncbi:methionyl-tRNA formyltransferase [Alloiococcus sp. CFN-8]|uniref:methionyl-tRNA formyltransferase n=1 Tax=Alloiococcus sp. CFN-8 TaxID=3416081 RepID=UPI003CFA0624
MKIVFMGTPDFSVPSLKALAESHDVAAVFTQPDRPKGRGKKLSMSPVKELALQKNIPVHQPEKLKNNNEVFEIIKSYQPDIIVVVAFGQILPKEILQLPRYGCVNLHASLLPKYRGAAPINWSIINGEKEAGNTTMLMAEGLDTGDMLLKDSIKLDENINAGELHDILASRGAKLLIDTLEGLEANNIVPMPQNDSLSTYASMLSKEMAVIDWNKSAEEIHNFIRGLNPWPVAYSYYENQMLKIYESEVTSQKSTEKPGTVIEVSKSGIKVSCGMGVILIKKIQLPNSKPMYVKDYINGNDLKVKALLGKEK